MDHRKEEIKGYLRAIHELSESLPFGMCLFHSQGEILYVNKAFVELSGMKSRKNESPSNLIDFFGQKFPRLRQEIVQAVTSGKTRVTEDFLEGNLNSQKPVYRRFVFIPFGKFLRDQYVICALEDVTERVFEYQSLRSALSNCQNATIVLDRDKKIVFMNHDAEILCGCDFLKVRNQPYGRFFHVMPVSFATKKREIVESVYRTGAVDTINSECRLRLPASEEKIVTLRMAFLEHRGAFHGVILSIRDISAEKEQDKIKSEFITVASHQLRTPVSSLKWLLEMLVEGDVGSLTHEQKDMLDSAYDVTKRMQVTLDEFLETSLLENHQLKIKKEKIDVLKIVHSVLKEMRPLVSARNVSVTIHESAQIGIVYSDPGFFRQIAQNLLDNAIRYNHGGGKVDVLLRRDKKKGHPVLIIQDTGIGIPKKEQWRVFQKFFRASNAVHIEPSGSGIGLYICKKLADLMNGSLSFTSKLNKGSVFTFSFKEDYGKK